MLHRQIVGLKIPSPEVQRHCGRARTVRKRNLSRADVWQRNRGYTSYEPWIRSKRLTGEARSGSKPARVEVGDRYSRKGISQEPEIVGVRADAVSGADNGLAGKTIGDSQSRIELPDSDFDPIVSGNATSAANEHAGCRRIKNAGTGVIAGGKGITLPPQPVGHCQFGCYLPAVPRIGVQ